MIDLTEQEGTPERAAERGRAEDLGFPPPGLPPSLGDPAVVSGLLAEFSQQVVGARSDYNADKLTGAQAVGRVSSLAAEYGAIVMGADKRYTALPWHSPPRLGRRIQLVVAGVPDVSDPGTLLFVTLGASLIDLAVQLEDGSMSDEAVKSAAQAMLQDFANLILGLR